MTPSPLGPVAEPDLRTLLDRRVAQAFYELNCHQVGRIVSFDAAKQSASVQLAIARNVVDRTKTPPEYVSRSYPVLTDVPVFVPSGSSGSLQFPIVAGDPVLVLFNDRDIDLWWDAGTEAPPNSVRAHSLSDGLAIVGFRNSQQALEDYPTDRTKLVYEDAGLELAAKVKLYGEESSLKLVVQKLIDALTALNAKTGPSAATQITAAQDEADKLLE